MVKPKPREQDEENGEASRLLTGRSSSLQDMTYSTSSSSSSGPPFSSSPARAHGPPLGMLHQDSIRITQHKQSTPRSHQQQGPLQLRQQDPLQLRKVEEGRRQTNHYLHAKAKPTPPPSSSNPSTPHTPSGSVPATPPNPRLSTPAGQHMLFWSFVGMVLFGLGNTVFCRLQTAPMYSYPIFLNIWANVFIVPLCFLYIWPATRAGWVSAQDRATPKYKFAIMGFLDMSSAVSSLVAITYMSSPALIIILQQAAIPISMALSRLFLKASFTPFQYGGALLVCLGLFFALIPALTSPPAAPSSSASVASPPYQGFWEVVLLLSNVPACLSSLYKEVALGETDMDVIYLNGWVALFQLVLTLPGALPSAYIQDLPWSQIPTNLWDGWRCYSVGRNSEPGDDCKLAPLFVNLYLIFNVMYNITSISIVKYGGANSMWLASTIMVPLSNLAFTLDFIPGHQRMGPWDLVGLCTIVTGLVVYRYWPDLHQWLVLEVLHLVRSRDYRRVKYSIANVNMQHRVFHHLHVPRPHQHPWHRPQVRYVSILGVNVLIGVLSFACGLAIGREITLKWGSKL